MNFNGEAGRGGGEGHISFFLDFWSHLLTTDVCESDNNNTEQQQDRDIRTDRETETETERDRQRQTGRTVSTTICWPAICNSDVKKTRPECVAQQITNVISQLVSAFRHSILLYY